MIETDSIPSRKRKETQKAYVARVLVSRGRLGQYEANYHLRYEDGASCAIPRLAATIIELRREGWTIETHAPHGQLATYILRSLPADAPVVERGINPAFAARYAAPAVAPPVVERAAPKAKAPSCPKSGCDETLADVREILGGYVRGKCLRHGKQVVKWP